MVHHPERAAQAELLRYYDEAGIKLVKLRPETKRPLEEGWPQKQAPVAEVEDWVRRGGAVGWQLGEVSGWLGCVDLDWREAIALAPQFLPDTLRGAKGKEAPSQYFYYAPELGYKKFSGLEQPPSEVGAIKASADGRGHQVVVAPSVHPEKGRYHFVGGFNPAAIAHIGKDELRRRIGHLMLAALIARNLPPVRDEGGGGRHDLALALAGLMLRHGEAPEDIERVLVAAWEHRDAPREAIDDVRRSVRDTQTRIERGDPATGGTRLGELIPRMPEKIADFLEWKVRQPEPAEEPEPTEAPVRPDIQVNDVPLRQAGFQSLVALRRRNVPPRLYTRTGELVRIQRNEKGELGIHDLDVDGVLFELTRAANYVRVGKDTVTDVFPPKDIARYVLASPNPRQFPALERITTTPTFRTDGTILSEPGYDEASALIYDPPETLKPSVPEHPSDQDVITAKALLTDWLGDFPYTSQASLANTLALALTPVMRGVIDGPVPLAAVDKPSPGTGASLLIEAIAIATSGQPPGALGAPSDDNEMRKAITSELREGKSWLFLDNVHVELKSSALARALTTSVWEDRILGVSKIARVPQRAVWVATGNNLRLSTEIARRCYWIRLDAKVAEPWRRKPSEFKHPQLIVWTAENRSHLLSALLALGRRWFAEGCPGPSKDTPIIGSFEEWSRVVGGVLHAAGVEGFLANSEELYRRATDDAGSWEAFLTAWFEGFGETPKTTKEVAEALYGRNDGYEELRETLPDEFGTPDPDLRDPGFTRRLGNTFSKREHVRYGPEGYRLIRDGTKKNASRWKVVCGGDAQRDEERPRL
jgi:hypothetical protein